MARITIDVKDATRDKLDRMVEKADMTIKDFILEKIGLKDE